MNEIETINSSSVLIAQNATGNITTAPQPSDWSSAYTMVYDAWNRLVTVTDGEDNLIIANTYDGQGWRITKNAAGRVQLREYYYSSQWQLITEQYGDLENYDYIWGQLGMNNLVMRYGGFRPGRIYPLSDPKGSITAVVDPEGHVRERYSYTGYGEPSFLGPHFHPIEKSSYYLTVLYASYYLDHEIAFYQVCNRYYNPDFGRWLSRDPIGYKGGINLYAYVGNNPVNHVDPYGLGFTPQPDPSYDPNAYYPQNDPSNAYGPRPQPTDPSRGPSGNTVGNAVGGLSDSFMGLVCPSTCNLGEVSNWQASVVQTFQQQTDAEFVQGQFNAIAAGVGLIITGGSPIDTFIEAADAPPAVAAAILAQGGIKTNSEPGKDLPDIVELAFQYERERQGYELTAQVQLRVTATWIKCKRRWFFGTRQSEQSGVFYYNSPTSIQSPSSADFENALIAAKAHLYK